MVGRQIGVLGREEGDKYVGGAGRLGAECLVMVVVSRREGEKQKGWGS